MARLTIRNMDESPKAVLRMKAAENGHFMEEEALQILKHFLLHKKRTIGIGTLISKRFAGVGGIDLPEIPRKQPRQLPKLAMDD